MEPPTSGAQLQQFVCALQWMHNAIPHFSAVVRPFSDLLERLYVQAEK